MSKRFWAIPSDSSASDVAAGRGSSLRSASMSHHYSGPDYGFPQGDARLDLTDLYAFPKPGAAGRSVLVMNVHPSESVSPPGPTTEVPFTSEGFYEICIDTNGD